MAIRIRWACNRTVVCAGFLFCSTLAPAEAQSSAGQLRAQEALVAPGSRHQFTSVVSNWVKREEYLARQGPEAFIVVPKPQRGSESPVLRQVTYFSRNQSGSQTGYVKLLRYDPDGRLTKEVDQTQNDRFERDFYPNSSIANYLHWHKGRGMVAGFSLDPGGKAMARLHNGSGEITTWVFGPDDFTHGWLSGGDYVLTKTYSHRILVSETFWLPSGDSLRITAAEERLTLATRREFWTEPVQGVPYGQVWPGQPPTQSGIKATPGAPSPASDAIHDRLAENAGSEVPQSANDYRSRRDEFLKQYVAYLLVAGRKDLLSDADPSADFARSATLEFERELSRTQDDKARRRLVRRFYEGLSTSREKRAAIALIAGGYVSPIPVDMQAEILTPFLKDPDRNIRQSTVRALGFVANRSDSDAPRLAKTFVSMLDAEPSLRVEALMALGLAHRHEFAGAVSPYLRDTVPAVRAEAAFCLATLSAPETTYETQIAELLQDTDRNVRQRAISALYVMNARSAEPYLEKMLGDQDAHIRVDTIHMLVYSHAVQASPAIRLLRDDPDEQVRKEVEEAIKRLAKPASR